MDILCTADMCPVILNATCVFYEGNSLLYTGITTNDSLQTALQKIDAKFGDAMVGYTFTNGVYQSVAGAPVGLGGNLTANTSIGGNFTLTFAGNLQAAKHITTGGTSAQFVKGDGTLDSTAYQAAGNYITALTGDVIANGPGSAAASLAVVNSNPGTYGSGSLIPVVTVDTKGRVTALTTTAINVPSGILSFVGDVYGSGTTGSATTLTLTNVNSNVYNSNTFLKFKVNAKGLVTGASPITHVDIEGVLGYVPTPETRKLSINGVQHDLQSDIYWNIATGVGSVTATPPLSSTGGATPNISITKADATTDGYLDNIDWVTFNAKQAALNGTGLVRMSGTTVSYDNTAYTPQSRTLTINGVTYDLSANRSWNIISMIYPEAGIAVSTGTGWATSITDNSSNWNTAYTERLSSASSPLSLVSNALSIAQASGSSDGYLSSGDWNTFNSKQAAGNYITALTGEATASGPGSASVTLSTPAVTGKLLTGVNITGGSIVDTDSILTAFGKVQNQINGLIGGSIYKGTWNASTNTPTITSGVGTTGWYYIVSVPGTTNIDGITDWNLGDWIIFDGTAWQQVDNTDAVVSVNGYTGAVSLVSSDIPEGLTNLYYTPARARTAISLTITGTSGAATYDNVTGVFNIPNYTTDLSGYVPYTGATTNVNLGERGITAGYVGFDLTPTGTPTGIGTMYWDPAYRTVNLIDGDGDTTLQIGQEERILVHNNTGSPLTDGQVVYVTGSTGNLPSVSLADASSETTSAATLGVVTEAIPNGTDGFVTVSGIVNGLNTLAFAEGDLLWLSETAGQYTNVKPIAPAHLVLIGYVIKRAGGNGSILVKIQNTQELAESSDVLISAPELDGQGLFLETISGTQLWRNRSIADVLGGKPITGLGTVNYVPKFNTTSSITNSNIQDSGTLITLGSNTNISSGALGIGTSSLTGVTLALAKTMTGATSVQGINNIGVIQSDVTISALYYQTFATTQSATFTINSINHYFANQGTFGAGSTVNSQYGFRVASTLIGATNNYAFFGDIPSGTNRWNIYMQGTANNYLAGSLGIGTTSLTGYNLRVQKNITGSTTSYGISNEGTIQSDVTSQVLYHQVLSNTAAASFTLNNLFYYNASQGTFGAGSSVSTQTGFNVNSTLIGATNNYGFRGQIPTGTGRWNIYMDGTALNYLAGNLLIGSTTDNGIKLQVTGQGYFSGAVGIGTTTLTGLSLAVVGLTRFTGTTASDTAPLGAELAAVTGTGTNWTLAGTDLNNGGYTHTVGSVVPLTTSLVAVSGTYYQIAYTITGRTAGSITIAYGGTSTSISATGITGPLASSTSVLTITPTTDFDGTVALSIKSIGTSSASSIFANSTGGIPLEIRASSVTSNTFIGTNAGRRVLSGIAANTFIGSNAGAQTTSGGNNTFIGNVAGQNTSTGSNNVFIGASAGQNNTVASSNVFIGSNSGSSNTTGSGNAFLGNAAGQLNSTGSNNANFGNSAGSTNTTGSGNTLFGNNAGRYIADGVTAATVLNQSILIGYNTRVLADSQINQIVIGYGTTGLGSNTTVLGNSSTTLTALYGAVITGGTSINASAQLQVDSTTKGFLPPRMTAAQRTAISSPASGLIVYQTDGVEGLWVKTSTTWRELTVV